MNREGMERLEPGTSTNNALAVLSNRTQQARHAIHHGDDPQQMAAIERWMHSLQSDLFVLYHAARDLELRAYGKRQDLEIERLRANAGANAGVETDG